MQDQAATGGGILDDANVFKAPSRHQHYVIPGHPRAAVGDGAGSSHRCWHRDQFRRVPHHASPASGSPPHSRLPHRDSRTRHCCPPNSRTPSARPSDRRSGFQPTPPRIPQPDVSAWPMMAWSGPASRYGDSRATPHVSTYYPQATQFKYVTTSGGHSEWGISSPFRRPAQGARIGLMRPRSWASVRRLVLVCRERLSTDPTKHSPSLPSP